MGRARGGSRRRPFVGKRKLVLTGLAVIVTAAVVLNSAHGAETSFIVGGRQASEEYPFMGSLQSPSGDHQCGAALVAPALMATAAHCVEGRQASEMTVRIGSRDRTSGGTRSQVARVVQAPEHADIALLVLSERVSGAPIEVADGSPQTQQAVRLIGWGQDCPQKGCSTAPPRQLKQLETKVLPAQDCPGIKGVGSCASPAPRRTRPATGTPAVRQW